LIVRTESGSVYEIDTDAPKCRRLSGVHDPTPRQGYDGLWKDVKYVDVPEVGEPIVFVWDIVDGVIKMTVTSVVVSVDA
jgi:hypothetical protein